MDVHRCRFVDWPPSPINALSFSQSSGPSGRGPPLRLAIGRANGDIEIWDPRQGNWCHEKTFPGGQDRSIEGLAWTTDPDSIDDAGNVTYGRLRLFSIGYSDTITEWDLITGTPSRQSSGSHGDIFCIAAQPRPARAKKKDKSASIAHSYPQDIAAGCADGSIVLFSTADEDLTFKKYVTRNVSKKNRGLSITWQTPEVVLVGGSDSTVRVFNVTSNQPLRTISLGAGIRGGPKEKLCWALHTLADGTIVTGDSSGELCWWDGKNFGQLQRWKAHDADVLCLTASSDGLTVVSGSMDRRSCVFRRGDNGRWSRIDSRRFHQHDVKALSTFENKSVSITVSGGIDAQPIIHPLREWGTEYHRSLSHAPQSSPITGAQRFVISWWTNQVSIWRVLPRESGSDEDEWTRPNYVLMSRLSLKVEEHITQAAITQGGDLLAVSTNAETKLFALRRAGDKLRVKKLDTPSLRKQGAKVLMFSRDSKWLMTVDTYSAVRVFRVISSNSGYSISARPLNPARVVRPAPVQTCLNGPWGSYSHSISRAAFSSDSRMIAVADLEGNIDSWQLDGQEEMPDSAEDSAVVLDSEESEASESETDDRGSEEAAKTPKRQSLFGQSWILTPKARSLPKLTAPPLTLSFVPSDSSTSHSFRADTLLALTVTHTLSLYSLKSGTLHDWSRRNPASTLPDEFKLQRDRAEGCFWDVESDSRCRAWLYGANWLAMFDLTQDLPLPERDQPLLHAPPEQATITHGADVLAVNGDEKALTRKRKRSNSFSQSLARSQMAAALASKKAGSGAGSRVKVGEVGGLDARGIVALDSEGNRSAVFQEEQPLRRRHDDEDDNDDDDDDLEMEATDTNLVRVRRGMNASAADTDSDEEDDVAANDGEQAETSKELRRFNAAPPPGRAFFITNRYRPILGIVPLVPADGDGALVHANGAESRRRERALEVALVERPLWEVDMPPRFGIERDREL